MSQRAVVLRSPQSKAPGPLTVLLPELLSVPLAYHGKRYKVHHLLGQGHTNAKLAKSDAANRGYRTFGLSLAPAETSGYQLCSSSSPGCRDACLFKQGRGVVHGTSAARIAKAVAFMEHRNWFAERLRWEIEGYSQRCRQDRLTAAFRLNVVSDVLWEQIFPWLFDEFPDVQFYDYTKHAKRAIKFAQGGGPANYHLTFSRSETNDADCLAVLVVGGNGTVVFRSAPLPSTWNGFPVIDGDQTDLRFLDPRQVVVGLIAKGTAKRDTSGFVVDALRIPLPVVAPR